VIVAYYYFLKIYQINEEFSIFSLYIKIFKINIVLLFFYVLLLKKYNIIYFDRIIEDI